MPTTIDRVIRNISGYWPGVDKELLTDAYSFAKEAHEGQERASGEPYIIHPLAVGEILTTVESDEFSVAAAFLHDTVEDTGVTSDDIAERFGSTVGELVDGVTKLSKLDFYSRKQEQARNLRNMFLAMAKDIRVILIKLADRVHNMRTIEYMPQAARKRIAEETLHIYAPLGHRLGVRKLRAELEDLSLKVLEPVHYEEIFRKIGLTHEERQHVIEYARKKLEDHIKMAGVEAAVHGRAKHIYSIHTKMKTQNIDFGQIRDLNALRVIVETIPECYQVLGIVHDLWVPIPETLTDHIAMPKSNQYQSLHTKVIGPDHSPMEVQIRTKEMHRQAEYGVASHWQYKEGQTDKKLDEQVSWIRQLVELQTDLSEGHEFLELLQVDFFKDQVFVFTPDGDVIDLPKGAGPIDFAYRIHTDIGNTCVGAIVNGSQVGLDYTFKNGDVAKITTSPSGAPRHDWLRLVQSSHAKTKVRRYLREQSKDENIAEGNGRIERAIARLTPAQKIIAKKADFAELAHHFNYPDADSLIAAIGYGDIEVSTVIAHIINQFEKPESLIEEAYMMLPAEVTDAQRSADKGPIPVSAGGVEGFYSHVSKCCNPLPGDRIRGYITRGTGLAIHRADCKNLAYRANIEPERIVDLTWSEEGKTRTFKQDIEVVAVDRVGLFSHITAIVADTNIDIAFVKAEKAESHLARLQITLEISRREDLTNVIERMGQLIDVVNVRRLGTPTDA